MKTFLISLVESSSLLFLSKPQSLPQCRQLRLHLKVHSGCFSDWFLQYFRHNFNLPILFLTNGQVIPDDIISVNSEYLANIIYKGKLY